MQNTTWQKLIPEGQAQEDFGFCGFYERNIKDTSLQLIALNTNLLLSINWLLWIQNLKTRFKFVLSLQLFLLSLKFRALSVSFTIARKVIFQKSINLTFNLLTRRQVINKIYIYTNSKCENWSKKPKTNSNFLFISVFKRFTWLLISRKFVKTMSRAHKRAQHIRPINILTTLDNKTKFKNKINLK